MVVGLFEILGLSPSILVALATMDHLAQHRPDTPHSRCTLHMAGAIPPKFSTVFLDTAKCEIGSAIFLQVGRIPNFLCRCEELVSGREKRPFKDRNARPILLHPLPKAAVRSLQSLVGFPTADLQAECSECRMRADVTECCDGREIGLFRGGVKNV